MTSLAITKELSSLLERPFVSLDLYVSLYGKYRSGSFAGWNRIEANRLNLDSGVHNDTYKESKFTCAKDIKELS